MAGVCGAASRTVELSPAVAALGTGICVTGSEFLLKRRIADAFPYISQLVGRVSYELMARIEISPRSHGHIFSSAAAAGYPLIYTWTAGQIQHIMIEGYRAALPLAAEHILSKYFVLLLHDFYIL